LAVYEEEIGKLLELLATIIEVSLVSYPEIEDWAELKTGVLSRMLKGEKDIPLRSLFLILECVIFDPANFFSIGSLASKPGTPWRDQVLRKLHEIGYGPVVFLPGERPVGNPRF
jgi:hypothetical protein